MIGEVVEKKKSSKLILIILLVVIFILASVVGYLVLRNKDFNEIVKVLKPDKEYTILLNEFVVNLQTKNERKSYLKAQISLMYTEKRNGKIIISNESKIRDVVLNHILEKNPDDIADAEKILKFKKEIITVINSALKDEVVKDVYFTDFIIQ